VAVSCEILAMTKRTLSVLLLGLAAACGSDGPGKLHTVDLGDTGFVIDIPEGWKVESPMKGFFDLEGGRPHPQIMISMSKANTVDELVASSSCQGRTVVAKESLASGGAFVSCKGESRMMKGVTTTQIVAEIPKGDESIRCHLETDKGVDMVSQICKSIRKKS
jgi:hypothetical protein